jgi:purine-nucleoside phosphorylase
MLISDHLNLTGKNPLVGPNDERIGPRFLDMTHAYDVAVQSGARSAAQTVGISLREGVYAGLLGPTYETPAEVRMLAALGASAVGMSTVLETIALRHVGVKVGAISCITNLAAGISKTPLSHAEVQETADRVRGQFTELVHEWVKAVA